MTSDFKPMLAGKAPERLADLNFPVLVSPKLDGIRCIIRDGVAVSRKLKPIPNEFVQQELAGLPDGLDGELMVPGGFNACQSAFMSRSGNPDFTFYVFDQFIPERESGFEERYMQLAAELPAMMATVAKAGGVPRVSLVQHWLAHSPSDIERMNADWLEQGYEGSMVRALHGPYKCGRSTTKQGWLVKVKQFEDEEAVVIGFEERMHNTNTKERDELGHAKRSHRKEGLVPAGDLGVLLCRTPDGAEFGIGSGFQQHEREDYWAAREDLLGMTVTYKHQPDPGGRQPGQAPRFPVFLGFRHDL